MTPDLYKTLGVRRNATKKAIQRAYRKLALAHHPDRNPGDEECKARFNEITLAYDILFDDARRARYDATGETAQEKAPPAVNVQALAYLSKCLNEAVNEVMAMCQRTAETDMVAAIRRVLTRLESKILTPRDNFRKAQEALKGTLGRFETAKEGDNFLDSLARSHLAGVEAKLEECDAELAIIKDARVLLKDYKFRQDAARGFWPTANNPFDFSGMMAEAFKVPPQIALGEPDA